LPDPHVEEWQDWQEVAVADVEGADEAGGGVEEGEEEEGEKGGGGEGEILDFGFWILADGLKVKG
jgi:hypothetical protein